MLDVGLGREMLLYVCCLAGGNGLEKGKGGRRWWWEENNGGVGREGVEMQIYPCLAIRGITGTADAGTMDHCPIAITVALYLPVRNGAFVDKTCHAAGEAKPSRTLHTIPYQRLRSPYLAHPHLKVRLVLLVSDIGRGAEGGLMQVRSECWIWN